MTVNRSYKYRISGELGIDFQDEGRWRSYELDAYGDTFEDLLDSAHISEVDQDGGVIDCYGIDDVPNNEIYDAVIKAAEWELADDPARAALSIHRDWR